MSASATRHTRTPAHWSINLITPEQLTAFNALCHHLPVLLGSTRNAIVSRKQQTAILQELIAKADHLLKSQVDKLVKMLKSTEPDFFKLYTGARTVVDLKGKTNKPKTTGTPPPDAGEG